MIGIRTQGKAGERYESMRSNWLKFHDGGRGSVTGYKNLYTRNFPSMEDTFTLEAVPSGCVTPGEYVLQMSVMAAPWHTSQEDFESKPDRCFWSDGWDTRRRNMMTAICYYSKGTKLPSVKERQAIRMTLELVIVNRRATESALMS